MATIIRKVVMLWLACVPLLLHAQKKEGKALVDSLQGELHKAREDTNKVHILHTLARLDYEFDLDATLKYAKQAAALARQLEYKPGEARAYNLLGGAYDHMGNHPEAMKCHMTALKLWQETGNKNGIAGCYFTMGNGWATQDNYPEAFKNYFAALRLFEDTRDTENIIGCYDNIASMYHFLRKDAEAMKYYSMSMQIAEKVGDKDDLANLNGNIGDVYFGENNFTTALQYYSTSLKLFEEIGQKNGIANCYNNLGEVYKMQKNYEAAMKNYKVAEQLMGEVGNKMSLGIVYGNIGVILEEQKKYREAERYFNRQLALGKETGALSLSLQAHSFLSGLYERMGDFKKSLEDYKEFVVIKDSIFNKDNTAKNVQAQMQYDFDKKESAAKAEEEKKDAVLELKLQRRNIFIYGSLSALVLLLIIGSLLFRQNKLRTEQQKTELEQKQLRAQMNPHFIFNCLNSIQHFVVINDVKNANKYLTGFASLMRQTLENSKEGSITLSKEIAYLENYLDLELMRFRDKFSAEISCPESINPGSIKIPAMIIQPFIENAIRHGLHNLKDRTGVLFIKFYLQGDDLFCEIDDNGIGRRESQKIKEAGSIVYESQGMELTRQRLALVSKSSGSDYSIQIIDKTGAGGQPEGTTVVIKFPLEA